MKNTDEKCFKYSILSKFDNRLNKCEFSKYNFKIVEKKNGLNFNCIDFPTPVKQIKTFERINNVTVNVFSLGDKSLIFPLYMNKNESDNHFDLILFNNNEASHYCYIKNFSRLIRSQKSKHESKLTICKICYTIFVISRVKTNYAIVMN